MYADTIALCIYGKEYISNNLIIDSLFQINTCFSIINNIIFSHDEINCFGNKEEIIDNITMSDDGTGYGVFILILFSYKSLAFLYQNQMERY